MTNLVTDPNRFAKAIERFDRENARDPNTEVVDGLTIPRELLYAQRLTNWVLKLAPDASEPLRLAARCQHICRWQIPRSQYEMTRAGYLKWRNDLKSFHANKAAEILRDLNYPEPIISRVQELNLKKHFPNDPESRILEDALCLVFLQFQFSELAAKTDEAKMINAIQKSWKKMTEQGREEALKLTYGPRETELLQKSLG